MESPIDSIKPGRALLSGSWNSNKFPKYWPLKRPLLIFWLSMVFIIIYSNLKDLDIAEPNNQLHEQCKQPVQHKKPLDDLASLITTNCFHTSHPFEDYQSSSSWFPSSRGQSFILFAEAGKKKKEKSEVVVISVNNPAPKGMGHMPYPIFVPSCGGHGGFGRRR